MCLSKITKVNPKKTSGVGYKVFRSFRSFGGALFFQFVGYKGTSEVPLGTWLEAEKSRIGIVGNPDTVLEYDSGFHIFLKKSDAERWTDSYGGLVVKVQYRKAKYLGHQFLIENGSLVALKVVVADEMFVSVQK